METETQTRPAWVDPRRFLAWCDTCQDETDSDSTGSRWCGACGDSRDQ